MNKTYKSALYITTAIGLGLSVSAPAPVARAQSSAQAGGGQPLEEIVVTARRVEERLQTVPISMSVFNQRQLTDKNISSAQDLGIMTPALSVTTQFGSENTVFSLRGFSSEIGTNATVGVFFADVVAPRGGVSGSQTHAGDGAGPGNFFDLQNVQVLKGPQGTLFGRNTTGGDVLLVPQKPTPDFGGYFEASGGNYGMEHMQAVINLPVNDKVRLRIGVDQQQRDGYMKNISGVGPSDFANTNYVAARVSAVVDVTDDIENYTIGSFSQSDTNGPLEKLIACTTKGALFIPVIGPMACNQMARDQGDFVGENGFAGANSFSRQWQIINTTTWQANDDLTVKNIASYSQLEGSLVSSLFGDNFKFGPTINLGGAVKPTGSLEGQHFIFTGIDHPPFGPGSDQQTYTEELQVHGINLDGKLSWQAGLYMEGSHPLGIAGADSPFLLTCTNYLAQQCVDPVSKLVYDNFNHLKTTVGNTHLSIGSITYRDYAAYGQADYAILDNLKFEAGLRVTDDSTTGQDFRPITLYQYGKPPNNSGCQVPSNIASPANGCLLSGHVSSRAPTWVLKLTYTPVEDVMTYASYSRGYRAGGIYLTGPADSALVSKYLSYQPETVDTYEIGAKTSYRGAVSGTFDISAFYNDFTNQQIQTGFNSNAKFSGPAATPTAAIANAGSSRIFGFDLNSTLMPYQGLTINFDYTYLNTKLLTLADVNLPASSAYISAPGAVPGSVLPYSPHHKLSANVTYRLPVDEALGTILVGATYTYTGAQGIQPADKFGYIAGYSLLNFNVNWESIAGTPVDAEFFMTNALDKVYQTYIFDQYATLGFASALYGEPRMFGGRLRYHFGGESEPTPAAAPYTPPPAVAPAPAVARSYMVFFNFDKSDLTSDAVAIVDQAAKNAGPAKVTQITVTGHTDTVGSDAYNMRLSKRRAESVAAQLEKDGIPSSEIALVAKGKRDLLVPTKDGVKEPQNRRVTIVYDGATS